MKNVLLTLLVIFIFCGNVEAQESKNKLLKYSTWILLQAIPSPTVIQDKNSEGSRVQLALKWQITPISYSFNTNKYVSPVQSLIINPVRKFSGSMEIFIQPEWATSSFKNADMGRFALSSGARIFLPVIERGEDVSVSFGSKINFRPNETSTDNYYSLEAGIYGLYGMFGIQASVNPNYKSSYDISFYLKYY